MSADPNVVRQARQHVLYAARDLLFEATEEAEVGRLDAADAVIVALLRVLDAYEAVAQLPDVHELAKDPHAPVPFRPVG